MIRMTSHRPLISGFFRMEKLSVLVCAESDFGVPVPMRFMHQGAIIEESWVRALVEGTCWATGKDILHEEPAPLGQSYIERFGARGDLGLKQLPMLHIECDRV